MLCMLHARCAAGLGAAGLRARLCGGKGWTVPPSRLLVTLAFSGLTGCSGPARVVDSSDSPARVVDASDSPPRVVETSESAQSSVNEPRASAGSGELRALEVDGFLPAVFFVPPGDAPARLVVATHGAGGAPEWECDYWRHLMNDSAFVLSLRGKSMGGGSYYYPNHFQLEAELNAAVRAARAAEPRILPDAGVYAGYSQGASMGSVMLPRHGAAFPHLVLIEGFELWNIARARRFQQSGGNRVLFVCGTAQCSHVAQESVRWLLKGGIDARLEYASGAGHTPAGAVMARVEAGLPWLLGD
jgi:predicted esterase